MEETPPAVAEKIQALAFAPSKFVVGSQSETRNLRERAKQLFMANIPKKVKDRLVAGIRRFQPILESAKARDVNESDTVLILTDILSDVFGYDKYSQITSELAIRGTYCDLAIKVDNKVVVLLEAKAIGHELKDQHVKQAIDYAANKGVEWAVLSNGVHWRIYRVIFGRPVDMELLVEFQFMQLDPKDEAHLQLLYLLTLKWTPKVGQRGTVLLNQKGTATHVQQTTPA